MCKSISRCTQIFPDVIQGLNFKKGCLFTYVTLKVVDSVISG